MWGKNGGGRRKGIRKSANAIDQVGSNLRREKTKSEKNGPQKKYSTTAIHLKAQKTREIV